MRHIGFITTAIVVCGTAALSAQTTGAAKPVPVAHITIVGCVEPSDQPAGTSGTSAGATNTKYMLTNAHETRRAAKTNAKSKSTTSSNKNSNSRSSSSASSNRTYQLSGNDAAVGAEVGHVVEIVAVEEAPRAGTTSATSAVEPVVIVEAVKAVSPTCR